LRETEIDAMIFGDDWKEDELTPAGGPWAGESREEGLEIARGNGLGTPTCNLR
jgi:hypothetical protein